MEKSLDYELTSFEDTSINCYNKRLFWTDFSNFEISKLVEAYGATSKGKCIKFKRFLAVTVSRQKAKGL